MAAPFRKLTWENAHGFVKLAGLPSASRLNRRRALGTQASNIADGGLAKQAAVFTIELTRTLISNGKGHARRVNAVGEHPCPRFLQPDLLLVLKRTHRRDRPEMMVKRRHRHACDVRKLLNAKRPAIVGSHPGDRFGGSVTLVPQSCDRP